MTENEQIFWNRVLELAQSQLKQATFDFFVSDAKLLKVEGNIATILLDDMKKLFWEKNNLFCYSNYYFNNCSCSFKSEQRI